MKFVPTTHRRKTPRGFSYLEMIIVIAIIGVLAYVLIPRNQNPGPTLGAGPSLETPTIVVVPDQVPVLGTNAQNELNLPTIARDLANIHVGYVKSGQITKNPAMTLAACLEAIDKNTPSGVNTAAITALREHKTKVNADTLKDYLALGTDGLLKVKDGTAENTGHKLLDVKA